MPPVQHSSSSKSAHKDSDQIPADQNYSLGDYSFRIERSSVPGSTNDKIEAICTKGGKNARKSIQIPSSSKLDGWYVEANGTEATVYAIVEVPDGYSPGGGVIPEDNVFDIEPFPYYGGRYCFGHRSGYYEPKEYYYMTYDQPVYSVFISGSGVTLLAASNSPNSFHYGFGIIDSPSPAEALSKSTPYSGGNYSYTYDGDTVYFWHDTHTQITDPSREPFTNTSPVERGNVIDHASQYAWLMIYGGEKKYVIKEMMVGRFPIELEDAGGDGPDSDWDDPGDDYDDDYDDYDDTEEYDDEFYLELDKWDGEPGESFTATITGHNGESIVVSVQPNDATEDILTYRLYAPASKDMPLTYTFTTDESWMRDGIYSRAFLVTAATDETARTANDGFTLYVEEPDMLTVDTNMDEGQPGETITAYVGGHSGHTFSAVVTNAVGDIVATFSHVVPQSQYSDVELPIVLNEAWFSSNSSSETLIITATTDDNRQASAVFKMVLELLTVSLDVDKYTAEVGEEVTWSMEAEGGNGNYQYNFFIFLDGELIRDGRWQFDNFLTYTPHSPGTYTVEGYVKDSRLSQNVKAPEDGEVIVEGEPEPEPEPEPDEITRTLYITVTGALSGRHNDPGKDPSYSYLPAEKSTIADYGCGGDGGHGGGGGAGASNVVVYKFATDKADNKETTAITKRPGFGSGGGKGGKGGDGCILVYY